MTAHPADPEATGVALSVHWERVTDLPALATNQLLVQVDLSSAGPDQVILVFGHVAPPPVTGTRREQARAMAELGSVGVQPVVRLTASLQRFREFLAVMNDMDAKMSAAQPGGDDE